MDDPTSRSRFRPEATSKPREISVTLHVNGEKRTLAVAPWTTLLDALRDRLHLTGTKKGCDHGQCGACTVLVEGRRINSCLTLAVMKDGAQGHDDRGARCRRSTASAAAGVHRSRRIPMRVLHARPDLLGGGPHRGGKGENRRRNSRADERQHLPLRCLSQHRRRYSAGDGRDGEQAMINFEYARATRRGRCRSANLRRS